MPSKNMLPKGKRRQSVKSEYRRQREAANDAAEKAREEDLARIYGPNKADAAEAESEAILVGAPDEGEIDGEVLDEEDDAVEVVLPAISPLSEGSQRSFVVDASARDLRLDQYLARAVPDISRCRVQLLIQQGQVLVEGAVPKSKLKLQGGEHIQIQGAPQPAPLRAEPEAIPLDIVYEDKDIAVINKPAGMMVHAGSGLTEDARSRGTLVNALLHHFKGKLSEVGGPLRPGIVHRLDKDTSGLILVAKNDKAHRALAEMFSGRSLEKRYIALVHRTVKKDSGTIDLPISRDRIRRTRMTTKTGESWITTASHGTPALRHPDEPEPRPERRAADARHARTHYTVLERLHTPAGDFTLLDVKIETGRTHQIRVHMQALGHPVVGDTLYGAPARIPGLESEDKTSPTLSRNFLHAAHLSLRHPVTGKPLELDAPLPTELDALLARLRMPAQVTPSPRRASKRDKNAD